MARAVVVAPNRYWWVLMVNGIAAILFGLSAIAWPGLTLVVLATLFALYLLVVGIADIIRGIMDIGQDSYWIARLLLGVLWIGLGVYLFNRPGVTLATFVLLLGLSLIVRGVVEVALAFSRGLDGGMRALAAIVGVLTVIVGVVVWRYPLHGGIAFTWVLGFYALISGPILIAEAIASKP